MCGVFMELHSSKLNAPVHRRRELFVAGCLLRFRLCSRLYNRRRVLRRHCIRQAPRTGSLRLEIAFEENLALHPQRKARETILL